MENENDKFIKCLNENKRLKQQLKELKDENFTCKEKLEIHQYTIELLQKEKSLKEELFKLNMQRYGGRVDKPHMFSLLKRDIARIETILNEKK